MPTRAPTKRETWADWMPGDLPEPRKLLTRDELIAELNGAGIDVAVNDLRFWEYEGILPRAVRRWHEGANRVLYPRWIASTIILLRALQEASTLSLHQTAPILKEESAEFAVLANGLERIEQDRPTPTDKEVPFSMFLGFGLTRFTEVALGEDLQRHADMVSRLFGKKVASIRLQLIGEDGERVKGGSYVQSID